MRGARGLASRLRCEKITRVARVAPLVPPTPYLFARLPSGVKLCGSSVGLRWVAPTLGSCPRMARGFHRTPPAPPRFSNKPATEENRGAANLNFFEELKAKVGN